MGKNRTSRPYVEDKCLEKRRELISHSLLKDHSFRIVFQSIREKNKKYEKCGMAKRCIIVGNMCWGRTYGEEWEGGDHDLHRSSQHLFIKCILFTTGSAKKINFLAINSKFRLFLTTSMVFDESFHRKIAFAGVFTCFTYLNISVA